MEDQSIPSRKSLWYIHHLFTDWIDNISSGNNDYYLSLGFTMNYVIHKLHFEKKEKIDLDIEAFNNSDEDNDGIIDIIDECPHTPKSIKVDLMGCPIDTEKMGFQIILIKNLTLKLQICR